MPSRWLLVLPLLACLLPAAYAASEAGVTLPDSAVVEGRTLTLNGLGVRKATMFKVKVYVMGLYLETPSRDPAAIIGSDRTKRIVLRFIRDVGAGDLRDAWQTGFERNAPNLGAVRAGLERLKAGMRDVQDGESLILDLIGDRVEVALGNDARYSITGRAFQEALLAVWLGPHPPNDELKQGILGQ